MDACRPALDAHLLALLTQRTLTVRDFVETRRGDCRVLAPLASMVPTRAIISLATRRGHFPEGLVRLRYSLERVGFTGEIMLWPPGSYPTGCPDHLDVPFAFKPFCFMEAGKRGVESVLWLDSSCVAIRRLEPIFRTIEERGYILFRGGQVGDWSSDEALAALGLSREQAREMSQIHGAAIGLSLAHPTAATFLQRWHEAARAGIAFRGTARRHSSWDEYADLKWNRAQRASSDPLVRGHRHDQAVAGVLAHELGMELSREGFQPYRRKRGIRPIRATTMVINDRGHLGATRLDLRLRRDKWLGSLAARIKSLVG
jgi:hypothetical protein